MYKILGIYHNGRKDTRMKPVDDLKYDGLVGSCMLWDIGGIKQFECTKFKVLSNGSYYWYTSEILQLTKKGKVYELETANTIYELEEVDGD